MFSIGFPESPAGHLDHFDIVGLETVIDCGDAGHVRGIDRSSVGESFGAGQRDEHRHCQTGLQRYIDMTVIAHAAASSAIVDLSRGPIRSEHADTRSIAAWLPVCRAGSCSCR